MATGASSRPASRGAATLSALACAALALSDAACAQQAVESAATAEPAATAQPAAAQRRPFSLSPNASITETLTDNVNLTPQKQAELITQPTLGLHADANTAWLKGFLDYSLSGLWYARGKAGDQFQNTLNALASAELVQNHLNVDVTGNISQQSISAFGVQSPDTSLNNPNQTTVSSFSVSPYFHGRLAGVADYEARLRYVDTRSNDASASNNTLSAESLKIGDSSVARKINWSGELSRTVIDYTEGVRNEDDLLRGVLSWNLNQEFALSAIGGSESNNYATPEKESHTVWGAGLKWVPSPRTSLSAEAERRFFGNSHNILFTHRSARTVWTLADTRDVSTNTSPTLGNLGTAYDLFFQQFASVEPDPVLRQQLVNNFLLANGINPTATAIARFLNSAVTLQRMQSLSFAWLGVRDTVSVSASQSWQQQLNVLSGAGSPVANATRVNQRGLLATVSHRLTPQSTIALAVTQQHTTGTIDSDTSTLRSLSALFTTKVGRRSDVSFGARRAVFTNVTTPYNESAIFGTIRAQF